jgi:hypothetical protein
MKQAVEGREEQMVVFVHGERGVGAVESLTFLLLLPVLFPHLLLNLKP